MQCAAQLVLGAIRREVVEVDRVSELPHAAVVFRCGCGEDRLHRRERMVIHRAAVNLDEVARDANLKADQVIALVCRTAKLAHAVGVIGKCPQVVVRLNMQVGSAREPDACRRVIGAIGSAGNQGRRFRRVFRDLREGFLGR